QQVVDILQKDIGVDVLLGQRVVKQSLIGGQAGNSDSNGYSLTLSDGRQITADCVIRCLGASTNYIKDLVDLPHLDDTEAPLLSPRGIRVKNTMQVDSSAYPNIYACGDICSRDEVKLAGVAMYGAYVAARNIARSILFGQQATLEEGI
ncbi:hypothetical protein EV175_007634, partial [Coemansia sp. RSA 1933]